MIIWLASYPKSGNTYVRAFLSAYYYSKNGEFNFGLLSKIKLFPDKEFFNETYNSEIGEYEGGYYPDRVDYKLDKKGFVLKYPEGHPEEGNPIPDEGFVKKALRKISPIIRKGINKLLNPLSSDFRVQAPPLPVTSQPKVQMASIKSPVTGLTRTESALLSPTEQVIARRT